MSGLFYWMIVFEALAAPHSCGANINLPCAGNPGIEFRSLAECKANGAIRLGKWLDHFPGDRMTTEPVYWSCEKYTDGRHAYRLPEGGARPPITGRLTYREDWEMP